VGKPNRILVASLCFFALLKPLPVSNASPSECPNEWNIPNNLFEATPEQKQELLSPNFNVSIKPNKDAEYSFDGLKWIKVKNGYLDIQSQYQFWNDPVLQKNADVRTLTNFFGKRWDEVSVISFGDLSWLKQSKIYLRTSVEISKQNCGPPSTYYYQGEFSPPGLETANSDDQIMTIVKNSFKNYQIFDSIMQRYKGCISKWQSYNNSSKLKKPLGYCSLEGYGVGWMPDIKLLPNEPNCLVFLPGDSDTASDIGIKPGTNCTYTILGFTADNKYFSQGLRGSQPRPTDHYNIRTGNLVSFGTLTINSPIKVIKLTCIKGKLTKIVSGVSPKCPSGYKKK
jgi:hypothetical protein